MYQLLRITKRHFELELTLSPMSLCVCYCARDGCYFCCCCLLPLLMMMYNIAQMKRNENILFTNCGSNKMRALNGKQPQRQMFYNIDKVSRLQRIEFNRIKQQRQRQRIANVDSKPKPFGSYIFVLVSVAVIT